MNRSALYQFPQPDPPKPCATEGCRGEASAFLEHCSRCHEELAALEVARLRAEVAAKMRGRARRGGGAWVLVLLAVMALLVVLFGSTR